MLSSLWEFTYCFDHESKFQKLYEENGTGVRSLDFLLDHGLIRKKNQNFYGCDKTQVVQFFFASVTPIVLKRYID